MEKSIKTSKKRHSRCARIGTLALLMTLGLAGCEALWTDPGDGFEIRLLNKPTKYVYEQPFVAYEQPGDVFEVRFQVSGCDDYHVYAQVEGEYADDFPYGGLGLWSPVLETRPLGDGTEQVFLPVRWLPGYVALRAVCSPGKRYTDSDWLYLEYDPNHTVAEWDHAISHLFPGDGPAEVFALGGGALSFWKKDADVFYQSDGWQVLSESDQPQMLVADQQAYLSLGCPIPGYPACGTVAVPDENGEDLWANLIGSCGFNDNGFNGIRDNVAVPGHTLAMTMTASGLVVLSEHPNSYPDSVILNSQNGQDWTHQVIANERLESFFVRRQDGSQVFATYGQDGVFRLRDTGGQVIGEDPFGFQGTYYRFSLSPDGEQALIWDIAANKSDAPLYLGTLGGDWSQFHSLVIPDPSIDSGERAGHAWGPDRLAVWSYSQVEVFDRSAEPQAVCSLDVSQDPLVAFYDKGRGLIVCPDEGGFCLGNHIRWVGLAGDMLVVVTTSGVRVYDADCQLKTRVWPLQSEPVDWTFSPDKQRFFFAEKDKLYRLDLASIR